MEELRIVVRKVEVIGILISDEERGRACCGMTQNDRTVFLVLGADWALCWGGAIPFCSS